MRNSTIQSIINTYNDRIFSINFDNNLLIMLGYNNHTSLADISFDKLTNIADNFYDNLPAGTPEPPVFSYDEVIKVKVTDNFNGTEIKYTIFHASEFVQFIGVMSEEDKDYRPDPIIIK